jgi:hypothetical protein
MKRGYPPGTQIRPRNAHGWRIPQVGTLSRRVYDLMLLQKGEKEIAQLVERKLSTISKTMHRIRHPDHDNAIELGRRNPTHETRSWYTIAKHHHGKK